MRVKKNNKLDAVIMNLFSFKNKERVSPATLPGSGKAFFYITKKKKKKRVDPDARR